MSPHCDLELEDSKPVFLHGTLAHDDASPNQVWLQKVKQLRRYRPGEHSLDFFLTFSVTLMHHHTKFGSKRLINSEDIIWTNVQ